MITAHSVRRIRSAEADLMATLPEGTLMRRAAAALAATCARLLRGPYGARVVLLVGSGLAQPALDGLQAIECARASLPGGVGRLAPQLTGSRPHVLRRLAQRVGARLRGA